MAMALQLQGCSLLLTTVVPPAKITCSNGLLYPKFSQFPIFRNRKSFTNCTLTAPFRNRATPLPKYVYPDPIPEFAEVETQKFKEQLLKKLAKNPSTFGNELNSVVEICTKLLGEYLHAEYGGPGTLLVEPFTNMFVALNEKKLPGATLAARTSLLWAQTHLDQDWNIWNSQLPK